MTLPLDRTEQESLKVPSYIGTHYFRFSHRKWAKLRWRKLKEQRQESGRWCVTVKLKCEVEGSVWETLSYPCMAKCCLIVVLPLGFKSLMIVGKAFAQDPTLALLPNGAEQQEVHNCNCRAAEVSWYISGLCNYFWVHFTFFLQCIRQHYSMRFSALLPHLLDKTCFFSHCGVESQVKAIFSPLRLIKYMWFWHCTDLRSHTTCTIPGGSQTDVPSLLWGGACQIALKYVTSMLEKCQGNPRSPHNGLCNFATFPAWF